MLRKLLAAVAFMLLLGSSPVYAQYAGLTPCAAKSLSVTTTTGNVALSSCGPTAILYNTTSQEAYYNLSGSSSVTATTSSFYIPGGGFIVLQVPSGTVWTLAGITPTSTTVFKIVQGAAKP